MCILFGVFLYFLEGCWIVDFGGLEIVFWEELVEWIYRVVGGNGNGLCVVYFLLCLLIGGLCFVEVVLLGLLLVIVG